jgi:hypothetical protein
VSGVRVPAPLLLTNQKLTTVPKTRRRSYNDYKRTCDLIAASIGKRSSLDQIVRQDLDKLWSDLANGKKGTCGPTTLKGHLTRARMVFRFINEHVAEKGIIPLGAHAAST